MYKRAQLNLIAKEYARQGTVPSTLKALRRAHESMRHVSKSTLWRFLKSRRGGNAVARARNRISDPALRRFVLSEAARKAARKARGKPTLREIQFARALAEIRTAAAAMARAEQRFVQRQAASEARGRPVLRESAFVRALAEIRTAAAAVARAENMVGMPEEWMGT